MLSGAGVPYLSAKCGRDSYCNAVATAQSRFELLLGIDYLAILDFVPETGIEAFAITALPNCQKLVIRSLHIDAALIQRMKKASAITCRTIVGADAGPEHLARCGAPVHSRVFDLMPDEVV